ncbi:hypothetical protein LTR56_014137 [Elasticomyces elasticus]|nr:hypothetical protein LTR56_014137 [Elasticomyces elasticus]KAK3662744.1 hypothetical protein LTR22_006360 [Elasticomyces elasticus]KAK4918032.1 hypothetical protein LTR49_014170 [Elasticomyces elasticus]KAK5754471.1 hypothetical protein LTS12_015426 [Elasticomyces elasticus]
MSPTRRSRRTARVKSTRETHKPPTVTTPSRTDLLGLPAELRLLIYDAIFEPLVASGEDSNVFYVTPRKPPRDPLGDYTSLIRTCQEVSHEAVQHFRKHYLPCVTFHFNDALTLHDFQHRILQHHRNVHDTVRFCISTGSEKHLGGTWNAPFFAVMQPYILATGFDDIAERMQEYRIPGRPHRLTRLRSLQGGIKVHTIRFHDTAPFTFTLRGLGADEQSLDTIYGKATGKFADIDWTRFENRDWMNLKPAKIPTPVAGCPLCTSNPVED